MKPMLSECTKLVDVMNIKFDLDWTELKCLFYFAGFERIIPAFPRYTIIGNEETGEHYMRIENATMEDDAEYQCQVGPRGIQKPIRANARLTVLSKHLNKPLTSLYQCIEISTNSS